MDKRTKIIYRVATGLFTLLMLMGSGMYFFNHEMVAEMFTKLGYPTYLIYPLAVAKLLGLTAIWTNKSEMLKEWAYAGFVFTFILAISAHINVGDGEFIPATFALTMVLISYIYDRKIYRSHENVA